MEKKNDSFADLFDNEQPKKIRRLNPGQRISATIAAISGESIFLDTGTKSEGILNAAELRDENGELTVSVGDTIKVYYIRSKASEHLFTARIGGGSGSAHLEEAWQSGIPVEGVVKEERKGGFEITLAGSIRAFCPYSQMGLRRVEDAAATYLGAHLSFKITRYEENGRNIVVSARAILVEERERLKEDLKKSLAVGMTVTGTVTSIRDFGAFVDIGGIEGLIPISEIGWSRVENIGDYLVPEQEVSVVIKSLDWEKDRFSFSLKQTLANPWDSAANDFPIGSTHTGKVVRLAQFGAFVTLTSGIDGLIHISKLGGGRRINHPREVVETGQNIDVTIEGIDNENQRISLVPADYQAPEAEEELERKKFKEFKANSSRKKEPKEIGGFGELLKKKLAEKGE